MGYKCKLSISFFFRFSQIYKNATYALLPLCRRLINVKKVKHLLNNSAADARKPNQIHCTKRDIYRTKSYLRHYVG